MAVFEVPGDNFYDYTDTNESSPSTSVLPASTTDLSLSAVPQSLEGYLDKLSITLSDWQKSQLKNVPESGVRCLLDMWLNKQKELPEGKYCNATWDNVYCWPPTPIKSIVSRTCTEILQESESILASHIQGDAFRVCDEDGTWLWGNWTNYTACADSYEEYVWNKEDERKLVVTVQHILFVGSLLSIVCLALALTIFYYFKCLRCDRVTVHLHLMVALLLRSVLLIVITEPFIFNRTSHYRHVDIICKVVLSTDLFATFASINWMFIQGVYLHGKLTTNIFYKETPFKVYYVIGWVIPLFLVLVHATALETFHPVQCWKGYSERSELWILLGPIIFALVANLIFMMNIMRIFLTKVQRPNNSSDAAQLRRAVKATLLLFPLLGLSNFLFLLNPGGQYHKYFVMLNATIGSTQGILVSILYCFLSKDVRAAIGRLYRRIKTRRNAHNSMRISYSVASSVLRNSTIPSSQVTHILTNGASGACNRSQELLFVHEVLRRSGTSPSPAPFSGGCRNGISHNAPVLLPEKVEKVNRYSVDIPLSEL